MDSCRERERTMNPTFISGAMTPMYKCGVCGKIFYSNKLALGCCSTQNTCKYCGKPVHHLVGRSCSECEYLVSAAKAKKKTLSKYVMESDNPLYTNKGDYFYWQSDDPNIPFFAFATRIDKAQIDFDDLMEDLQENYGYDVEYRELEYLRAAIEYWNVRQNDGQVLVDWSTLVVASWQHYNKIVAPFEFQLASGMFFYFWDGE